MKIYYYLRLHIKIICRRFRIIAFTFEIYALEICEMFIYKHTERIEYFKKIDFEKCLKSQKFLGLSVHNFQGIVF